MQFNNSEEILRVEQAITKTNSPYLKQDYYKYLKKLKREKYVQTNSI